MASSTSSRRIGLLLGQMLHVKAQVQQIQAVRNAPQRRSASAEAHQFADEIGQGDQPPARLLHGRLPAVEIERGQRHLGPGSSPRGTRSGPAARRATAGRRRAWPDGRRHAADRCSTPAACRPRGRAPASPRRAPDSGRRPTRAHRTAAAASAAASAGPASRCSGVLPATGAPRLRPGRRSPAAGWAARLAPVAPAGRTGPAARSRTG